MKKSVFIFSLLISVTAMSATWKKTTVTPPAISTGTAGTALTSAQCPTNYIFIPKSSPYTFSDFCVSKYEMKDDGYGSPTAKATGTPWTTINRITSRIKCQSLGAGYDLISNDQWQTIARNITGVAANWSTALYSGALNQGHSDGNPNNPLAAVTDDNDPCNGTGQTCSSSVWSSQRRTHVLSNGNVIWDFAANVYEWVTNDSNVAYSGDAYVATLSAGDIRQSRYGSAAGTFCAAPGGSPFCGMGAARVGYTGGAVARGGTWSMGDQSGIFTVSLEADPTFGDVIAGFRCIFTH